MKNIKIEKGLIGPDWWKSTFAIEVKGDPAAADLPTGLGQAEKEKIIQSWKTVAVLEAEPKDTPFHVGFISGSYIGVLNYPIETLAGRFGMRIGRGGVQFFAFDSGLQKELQLKLVETTTEDDSKYKNLPLY